MFTDKLFVVLLITIFHFMSWYFSKFFRLLRKALYTKILPYWFVVVATRIQYGYWNRTNEPICDSCQPCCLPTPNLNLARNWYLLHRLVLCLRGHLNEIHPRPLQGIISCTLCCIIYGFWNCFSLIVGRYIYLMELWW